MFLKSSSRKALLEQLQLQLADQRALTEAIQKHIAVIEFNPDKTIRFANTGFLEMVGYRLEDLERQPHAIFCDPGVADSREYRAFWEQLHQGRSQAGTFMRRRQDGSALWIEATYFPIMQEGRLQKVVKFAADVTESKLRQDSQRALYEAFNRSQAIIEFSPAGEVLGANDNFLRVVGYRLEEIVGKHHRLFCSDAFYEDNPHFWRDLAAGEFKSGQFDRISRSGARVWLEATYNPVFDDSGNVIKVVKLASDITARVERADAIQQAAEVAHSTAVETAQISEQGTGVLTRTVEISSQIDDEVHRTAELIGKLNTQSEAISQIVTTIGSIADQTNLLALNAAIEAARAGDHGRGFAVVADEVRQLAARTGKSTVEIEGMVRQNSELAREVKSSMDRVRAQAAESNQLINEAAAVIDEIRQGAENVSQTVVELT